MIKLFLIFSIIVFASSITVSSQTVPLEVEGIKIGTSFADVVQKIGKPKSTLMDETFPCDDSKVLKVRYSGLTLRLIEGLKENEYIVGEIKITSEKWSVAGIKIGNTINEVKEKFGESEIEKGEGFDIIGYANLDGYSYFYFRGARLVEIMWELNTC